MNRFKILHDTSISELFGPYISCIFITNDTLQNKIAVTVTFKMRWAGHVARMEKTRRMHIGYWWES
jgi:hypothetical protein